MRYIPVLVFLSVGAAASLFAVVAGGWWSGIAGILVGLVTAAIFAGIATAMTYTEGAPARRLLSTWLLYTVAQPVVGVGAICLYRLVL